MNLVAGRAGAVGGARRRDSTATTASTGAAVKPCTSEERLAYVLVLSTLVGSGSGSYYWAGTVQPRGTLRRRE